MPLLNKLFGKKNKKEKKISEPEIKKSVVEGDKKAALSFNQIKSDILLSPINTEKAISGQSMGSYIFKIAPGANKIEASKAIGRAYNVKVVSVNIINVPKKARQVGRTKGFRAGYKKAIVTLAKGQSIEIK